MQTRPKTQMPQRLLSAALGVKKLMYPSGPLLGKLVFILEYVNGNALIFAQENLRHLMVGTFLQDQVRASASRKNVLYEVRLVDGFPDTGGKLNRLGIA